MEADQVITDPIGMAATSRPSTPTSVKLYSPSTSPNKIKTPTISVGGTKTGNTVYIYKSSTCRTAIKSQKASSGTTKIKLGTLADGTYKFYAKQRNGAGYSSCKGYATYVLDTHAPIAPTVTSPILGTSVGSTTTITGTCESSGTVYIAGDVTPTTTATCSGGFFTKTVTTATGDGAKVITLRQKDKAGNYSSYLNLNLTRDTVAPTVAIDQSAGQSDPTNNQVVSFDVTFSEAIDPASFSALDITNFGSATGIIWDAPSTTDNITWTITTSSIATNGSVIPALFPNAVTDFAGNGNESSSSTDGSVTFDTSVPTITIGSPSPSNISSGDIDYAVTYSGASTINLTSGDVTVNATGTVSYSVSVLDGSTSSPTIRVNITGGDGIIDSISIAAGTSTDTAGNADAGATQAADATVDNTAPTLTIGTPSVNAINTGAINYSVTYTGADSINLTASNVTVNTTGTVTYTKAISNGTTVNPTIIVTVTGGDGNIDSVSVAAGTSQDSVGLFDAGSSEGTDVSVDNTAPTINIGAPSTTSINNGNVDYAVTYTDADSANLIANNVTVNTTGSVTFTKTILNGTSMTPTVRITVTSGDGTIDSISIAGGSGSDAVGNTDLGASEFTDVDVDNTAPTASIGTPSTTLVNTGNVDYAVTYSGSSTVNLTNGNVTVNTSGAVSYSVSILDGTTTAPTIRVSILGGDGSITGIQIAAGTSSDTVGNTDSGASSLIPVVVDNDAPVVVIGAASPSTINIGNINYPVTYTGANNSINLISGNVSVVTTGSVTYNLNILSGTTANPVIVVDVTGGDGTIDSVSIAAGSSTDTAGNADAGAVQNADVFVDNTNPTINIGTLSVINNANQTAYGFSGTCSEDGQNVTLTAPVSATATCVTGAFNFANLNLTSQADGSITFTVDTVDTAGNTATDSGSINKDTTAPTISIGALVDINNTNKTAYAFSGTCSEDGETVNLTAPVSATATCVTGAFNFSGLDVSAEVDGSVGFVVDMNDAAGNNGTNSASANKDTTDPIVAIGSPSTIALNTGDVDYAVTYTGATTINLTTGDVTVNTTGSVTYAKSILNGTTDHPTIRVQITGGDGSIDSIAIAAGTSSDASGNTDAGANQGTDVTVDNTAPTVSIGAPSTTSLNTGVVDYAVTYTGATVINLVAANHVTVNTTGTVTYSKSVINGTTTNPTIRITITGGDGTIDSIAIAAASSHDDVGNLDVGASENTDVTVDNTNPTVAIGTLSIINNANKTSYSFNGTCSEEGQAVNLTAPISASATCTSSAYTFSNLDVSAEADGSVTFNVSISDAVSNLGTDAANINKDTVNPTIGIDALSYIGNSNKTAFAFTGTCSENGQTIHLTSPISASTTCASNTYAFSNLDVSAEADGTVTIAVSITDVAGNTGTDSDTTNKDTVDPTVAIGAPSTTALNTGNVDYAVTYTDADIINLLASHVTVNATGTVTYSKSIIAGTTATPTIRIAITGGDGSINSIAISPGSSHDGVGNLDAGASENTSVTIDNTAPTVSIGAPSTTIINTGNVDYAVTYSGTSSVNLTSGNVTVDTTGAISYSVTIINGTTATPTLRIVISGGDGSISGVHIAAGTGTDAVGNADVGASSLTPVVVDNDAPVVVIGTPSVSVINTGNVDYAVTYTGADGSISLNAINVTVNATGTVTFSKSVIGGATATPTIRIAITGGDGTIDSVAIAAGTSTDSAGNADAGASQGANVNVDNTDPTINIGTLSVINNANKTSYSFNGTCSENGEAVNLTAPISASTTCASGAFNFSNLDLSAQADGTVTFTASISDAASNNVADSDTAAKDTSMPTASINTLAVINNTNKTSYSFNGTCSANGDTISITAPASISGTTTCASGVFSFSSKDVSAEADGSVNFSIHIQDAAGNADNASASTTKDTVDPTVAISAMSVINNGNKNSYAFAGTCSENGQNVTITAPTSISGTAVCTAGAFSFNSKDVSAEADGTVTFTVSTSDTAGNTITGSNTANKDTVDPTVTINSLTVINNANKTSYSFNGSCSANGDTITITAPASISGSTTCSGGAFSFSGKDVSAEADGSVTISVQASDTAGNTSTDSASTTKDASDPTVAINTLAVINNANKTSYTFSGTCSENGQNVTITAPASISGTAVCTSNAFSFSGKDVSAEADGSVTFSVSISDAAGNTGTGSNTATKDTSDPTIAISSMSFINNANKTAYNFSGTCSENGQTVTITAPTSISGTTTCASNAFSFSGKDVSAEADGSVTFTVSISDVAGNSGTGSNTAAKDTVDPTATINTLSVINNANKASYAFSGTCTANGDIVTITAPASIAGSTTCASGSFSFTNKDVSAEADGSVTFTVSIADTAGNSATDSSSVTKDTSNPTIAISAMSVINNANKTNYGFSGTCSENGQTVTITAPASISGTATCASNAFSFSGKDVSAESDGTVNFTVSTVDAAGNMGTGSNTASKDTSNPTISITAMSVINNANKTNYGFSGTCSENGQTVTITAPASISGTTTCASNAFNFSGKNVSGEADGSVTFTVSIADTAGNSGTGSNTATKDTSDPTISITAMSVINNANKTNYGFSGTCSENGQTVTITAPASISGTTTCASNAFNFSGKNVSAEADGSVTFTVSIADATGNTGSGSNAATKDTSDPTVAISAMSVINNANKASYAFSGTCSENGQTVTITAPASISGTATCASNAFSFSGKDVSAEADGSVTFTVSISDAAGNSGTGSNTATKDTSDPTVAIGAPSTTALNTGDVDYAVTYTGASTINLTASDVSVTVTGTVTYSKSIIAGTTATPTIRVQITGGDGTIDSVAIAASTSTDTAGNADAGNSQGTDVTVDNTAPTVNIGVPSTTIINTGNVDYAVTYVGTSSVNLTSGDVTVDTTGAVSYSVSIIDGTTTTPTLRIAISGGDGSISGVHIAATTSSDAVGNNDAGASNLTPVVVDNDAPVVVIGTPSVSNINTGDVDYAVTYTGADASISLNAINITVNATGTVTYSKSVIGGATATPTIRITITGGDGTIDSVAIAAGTSTDTAGNADAGASQGANVDVDNTDPTIAIDALSVINNANKLSYSFNGTCSENGQTVTITAPASISGTTTCASGAFSFSNKDVSAEADGAVIFTVTISDATGNTNTDSNTAAKDVVIPTAAIDSMSVINNANKTSYSFSGTCTANGDIIAITAPASISGSTTCSGGTFSFSNKDVSAESDGSVTFTVSATDAAGNTDTGSNSTTKDTINPTLAIDAMSAINNANQSSYGFSGTCSENGQTITITVPASVSGSTTCSGGTFSFSNKDVSAESDGSVTFTVSTTDATGNIGTGSNAATKDTVNPTASVSAMSYINNANKTSYSFSGTCTANGDTIAITAPASISGSTTCASGAFSFSNKDVSAESDGSVTFTVSATDAVGNSDSGSNSTTKDTVNPTVAIDAMNAINNANKTSYSFNGTCSENGQTVTITAPASISGTTTCASNAFSFSSKDVSGESDGSVTFTVSTVDAAGNTGSGSNSATKDTVNPTVTIGTMSYINNTNKAAYSLSGSCSENGSSIAITAPAVTGSTTCASNVYTISSIDMTSIPDGTVNFTVTATDAVGNTGTGSNSTTKDIIAPSIAGITLNSPASSPGNDTTPTLEITGTFPIGDNFELFTDATCTTSASNSTVASGSNSILVISATLSTNQTYTFFAKGTDTVGNTTCSGAGISVNYALDTVVPTVTISAPGYINNSNKTAFTFGGTCSANGDTITITGPSGVTGSTTCASSAFSFTKDFSGQADGTVAISVQASDTAGNTATDSNTATKDTVNPTITNGTLNYASGSNYTAYSFSGTCSENGQTVTLSLPISATTTCLGGAFTFSNLNLSAQSEGNNTFTTTIADVAGNTGSDSDIGVKDTIAPTTPACVSQGTDGVPARSNTQTWTGSTDATSGINYYEMSLGISAAGDTIAWTSIGSTVAPYQFTGISPVLLYDTLYRAYIRVRDNAGNISSTATCSQWELKRGYGLFKGTQTTNSTTLNQATAYALQYSASSFNSQYFTHSTVSNTQNITIQYAGNYLLSLNVPVYRTGTAASPGAMSATVKVNGTAVSTGYSANSFTAGNTTNPRGSSNHITILLENLAVSDVITVETANIALATNAMTVPSGKQFSAVLEYIPNEAEIFTATGSTVVGGSTNMNPASATKILWTESIKDSTYTHSNVTNAENITLGSAGNYLVSVNVPVTGAVTSAKPTTTIFVGGSSNTTNNGTTTINASAFISNSSGHVTSSANYTNIIYGVTAGQVLDVRQIATTAGTLTVPSGKVASIYIQKLDTSSDYYIGNGTTTSWNAASATNVGWTTDKQIDTSIFTHSTSTNTHQITVSAAGDYMLFFSNYITSTTSYTNPIVYVLINGVATPVGVCKAHHNLSTAALRPMSCNLQTMLTLNASDIISMTTIRDVSTGTASNSNVPRLTIRKISN